MPLHLEHWILGLGLDDLILHRATAPDGQPSQGQTDEQPIRSQHVRSPDVRPDLLLLIRREWR